MDTDPLFVEGNLLSLQPELCKISLNFIRLNRGNCSFSKQNFQIWWEISGIEKTYKISPQHLNNMPARPKETTGTRGVKANTGIFI